MAKITDFINGPVFYDKFGQYFWVTDKQDGTHGTHMLGELRGWGHIHTMSAFRIPRDGSIDLDAAETFQDLIGEFVAQAINEKIERDYDLPKKDK